MARIFNVILVQPICLVTLGNTTANSIMFYLSLGNMLSHELSTLHLVKAYCLSALLYGAESWSANEAGIHKASVAWNNSFRHIFHGYWRESVKPLQYFCELLPLSYLLDQRRLLF